VSSATIRFLGPRDIEAVLQIQAANREAAQWSRAAYENLGDATHRGWVAERDGAIIGFLVARALSGEMEILNLAVASSIRRQGVGAVLLREALSWAGQSGATRAFLEVRASNAAARQFYEAHGFASAGVRPNYYRDPVEAALLLARSLDNK
jgi:[ribosomal protein S18]-alanine N-acetyltransferase